MNAQRQNRALMCCVASCVVVTCIASMGCGKSAPVAEADPSKRSLTPKSEIPQTAVSSAKAARSTAATSKEKSSSNNDVSKDLVPSKTEPMQVKNPLPESSTPDPLLAKPADGSPDSIVDETPNRQPIQDESASTPSSAYRIWIPTTRGPLLVGLDIHVGGRTLKQAYDEKQKQILVDLKSESSSEIDWDEFLDHVAENQATFGRAAPQVNTNKKDLIKRYDRNDNQRVDADEMMKFVYRDVRFENELRVFGTDAFRWSNRSRSKLFAAIDADQNGKLDQAEIDHAGTALARVVDVNSDGCIDLMEAALTAPLSENAWGRRRSHRQGDVAMDLSGFVNWANLSYAMGGMFGSSLFEDSESNRGLVEQLDQDADRNVSSDEAESVLEMAPAFDVHLKLEETPGLGSEIRITPRDDLHSTFTTHCSDGRGWISSDSITVLVIAHDSSTRTQTIPRIAFDQLDANNDGGIDESEIPDGAEETLPFDTLDQNMDGKLSYTEINRSVSPSESVWATQVRGRAAEFPSGVFAWLDLNRDMLLSERELASTSTRLSKLMNESGKSRQWLRPTDLPDTILIQFGRGEPGEDERRFQLTRGTDSPALSRPSWAVHMDSNRDGDISQNEFIGTLEQFKSMDRNKDHFIGDDEL